MAAWEHGNSQIHARRRSCLAGRAALPDRLVTLIVDTKDGARRIMNALAGQPFEFAVVHDPAEALLAVGRTCPDVVLLAPTSGRIGPRTFVEVVRASEPELPIIVGVSPEDPDLAGHAAMLGATVLAYPFQPGRTARMLAGIGPADRSIDVRPFELDFGRLRIDGSVPQIWLDGTQIKLPLREYLVLRYLAERAGAVVSRQQILRAVWGEQGGRGHNTLTVHIMRLRRKLSDDEADPQWIKVIRGLGYQFTVPSP